MEEGAEQAACATCGRVFSSGERFCPFDRTELRVPSRAGSSPLIGTVIADSYTIIEKLGAGGMGVVYRARQHRLARDVAVKVLSAQLGADPSAADRFRTEALAVSQLRNPHTVTVYDFGATPDGLLYLVMQLLEGETLKARLHRDPPDLRAAVAMMAQVCESLSEAHGRRPQIIHRDIKPDNLIVRRTEAGEDFVTVLDFGLARLADGGRVTVSGTVVGTPLYMSPEQARGEPALDARVDLYAIGVVLYELISGRPPFTGASGSSILYKHMMDPPTPLSQACPDISLPPELDQLVLQLLAKAPEDRPASAMVVRQRLVDIARSLPEVPAQIPIDVSMTPAIVMPVTPNAVTVTVAAVSASPATARSASHGTEWDLPAAGSAQRPATRVPRRWPLWITASAVVVIAIITGVVRAATGTAPALGPSAAVAIPPVAVVSPPPVAAISAERSPVTVPTAAAIAAVRAVEPAEHAPLPSVAQPAESSPSPTAGGAAVHHSHTGKRKPARTASHNTSTAADSDDFPVVPEK